MDMGEGYPSSFDTPARCHLSYISLIKQCLAVNPRAVP